MKIRLFLVSALVALSAAWPVRAAAVPLVDLVGDDTSLVVYIPDAPALVKNWQNTPWVKTWRDEQVKKYFAPLRTQLKMDAWDDLCKTNTGYTAAGLLDFATGEAIFVLPDLGTIIAADQNKTDPPPLLAAIEIGDRSAKIEKLIADAEAGDKDKKITETTEDFDGVTLHILGVTTQNEAAPQHPGIWAITGGVFYASSSRDFLQQTLAAAKQGGHDSPLGKSDGFMQMRQRTGDAQFIFYANLKAMYPAAKKAIAAQKARGAGNSNPMAFDPAAILTALGLDADNELYFTAKIGAAATDIDFGLTYSERRGLAKLFAYVNGAPAQPRFVPEKCFAVSSARFSLKNFYGALEEMLGNINPLLSGMFQGYVKTLNARFGIDLKRDLIGNFGDQAIVATALNDAAPADAPANERLSQFYAISLENATALTAAIESIKHGLLGESVDKFFEKRAYLGHDIYTYAPPQPPAADGSPPRPAGRGFSYAVTDQWFFIGIGSAALVENALQGLDGKHASFWDKEEVKRNLLADVPDNACGFNYVDLSKIIPVYFDLAVQGMESSRKMAAMHGAVRRNQSGGNPDRMGAAEAEKPLIDDTAKPDADTLEKYWGYSRGYFYQDATGTYSTTRVANPNNP